MSTRVFDALDSVLDSFNDLQVNRLRALDEAIDSINRVDTRRLSQFSDMIDRTIANMLTSIQGLRSEAGRIQAIRLTPGIHEVTGEETLIQEIVPFEQIQEAISGLSEESREAVLQLSGFSDLISNFLANVSGFELRDGGVFGQMGDDAIPVDMLDNLQSMVPSMESASASMGSMGAAAGPAGAILQAFEGTVSKLGELKIPGLKILTNAFDQMIEIAKNPIEGTVGALVDMINAWIEITGIMEPFTELLTVFGDLITAGLSPAINDLYEALFQPQIIALVEELANALVQFLIPSIEIFTRIINSMIETGAMDSLVELAGVITGVVLEIITFVNEMMDTHSEMIESLLEMFVTLVNAINWDSLISVFGSFVDLLIDMFELIPWDFVLDRLLGFVDTFIMIAENIPWSTIQTVANTFINNFRSFMNGIINIVNSFANAFNSVPDPLGILPTLPTIPALAEGGLVTSPMLAIVGDVPEIVVPLDRLGGGGIGGGEGLGQTVNNYTFQGIIGNEQVELIARKVWEIENTRFT